MAQDLTDAEVRQLYRQNPYVVPAPPEDNFDPDRDPFLGQVGRAELGAYLVKDRETLELTRQILSQSGDDAPAVQTPNPHPDAQWFPDAGLGLFMHWGIHSVVGAQPSWAMIKDYPYAGDVRLYPPSRYFSLAERFDPQHWDPDGFIGRAAEAGFKYAVLTVKHHDGYALWPSQYGDFNSGVYLAGRDLVRDYVEACRAHDVKVGLYFSPRDWHYPGYPVRPGNFDQGQRRYRYDVDPAENQARFEQFFAFTLGQLHELLTDYGKIDLLWFDGQSWQGIDDMRTRAVYAWIRSLQPGIVINDRWSKVRDPDAQDDRVAFGDFHTVENRATDRAPGTWWETCMIWDTRGGWGYDVTEQLRGLNWTLKLLINQRARGGNLLLNLGPRPTGDMTRGFYERLPEIEAWLDRHNPAVLEGAKPLDDPGVTDVPATVNDGHYYLFVEPGRSEPIDLSTDRPIASAKMLADDAAVEFRRVDGRVRFVLPKSYDHWSAVAVEFE